MHQNPLARFQEKIEGTSINLHNEMSTCVTVLDWELLAVTVVISISIRGIGGEGEGHFLSQMKGINKTIIIKTSR